MHLIRHGLECYSFMKEERLPQQTQPESPPQVSFWTWRPLTLRMSPGSCQNGREPGCRQGESARSVLSWGRNKETVDCLSPRSAGHCRDSCLWILEPLEKPAEHSRVPAGINNKSKSMAQMIKWKNSQQEEACLSVFIRGLAQRFPGQDPKIWQMCKIMRNNYNLGCWETINRLNLFSSAISHNLTSPVMHSACCYTYS